MSWESALAEARDLSRIYGHRYRVEGWRNWRGQWRYGVRMGNR